MFKHLSPGFLINESRAKFEVENRSLTGLRPLQQKVLNLRKLIQMLEKCKSKSIPRCLGRETGYRGKPGILQDWGSCDRRSNRRGPMKSFYSY